jgi:hypothetical protein
MEEALLISIYIRFSGVVYPQSNVLMYGASEERTCFEATTTKEETRFFVEPFAKSFHNTIFRDLSENGTKALGLFVACSTKQVLFAWLIQRNKSQTDEDNL